MRVSRNLDSVAVIFDDDNPGANPRLILPATLAQHLDLEQLINERVRLTDSSAGFRPGRKALTLVHSMIAGADSGRRRRCAPGRDEFGRARLPCRHRRDPLRADA